MSLCTFFLVCKSCDHEPVTKWETPNQKGCDHKPDTERDTPYETGCDHEPDTYLTSSLPVRAAGLLKYDVCLLLWLKEESLDEVL